MRKVVFFRKDLKGLSRVRSRKRRERMLVGVVGGEKILHRTRRLVFHTCVTHVPRWGVGLKDFFFVSTH